MARMLGKVRPSFCPICRAPAGLDCPDVRRGKRQVRAHERLEVRRMVDRYR